MPRPGVARGGHGEGSIYPRKDGRWVSYIRLPDGRKKFFTGTREVVKARLLEAQRQAHVGQLVLGRDHAVSLYLEHWLTDSVRHSVRPKTYENYDLCVRRVLPYIGRVRLRSLTPEQIQFALGKLLDAGLARRTVRQVHMVVRRALKQAVLWRMLPSNPSDAVKPPRPERNEMQTLDEGEVRQLLAATTAMRDHGLWVFLVTTGVRLGEALAVRWSDVDSKECLWQEHDLVFPNPLGRPRDAAYRSISFHTAPKRAGLPRLRLHDLRHTAATHLLTNHVHPKVVQDLLGHSTIAITLDTYSHVMQPLAKDASGHMSSLVPSRPDSSHA